MNERLRRAPEVPFRRVGGDLIVSPPAADGFEMLSGPAVDMWMLLETPRTVGEIVDVLASRYGTRAEVVEYHVREVLERFRATGAVEVDDDDP